MDPSPELGDQDSRSLLPPVRLYRPGKGAVPRDADVIRPHPPLYAGDFDNRKLKGAYYWEGLDRNNPEDERLRLGLHYGKERNPRCDLCEREDRACMSLLGKKYQTTGCALCIRRHFQCSQANSIQKSAPSVQKNATNVRKNKDPPFRPSGHAHKRAFKKVGNREGTEPPAKRTRASLTGKSFEFLQLTTHDDDDEDEYHTPPVESKRGSIYTLEFSNQGSEDSYRDLPDLRQAEDYQMLWEEPKAIAGDSARRSSSRKSDPEGQQMMSIRERSVPRDRDQIDQREISHSHWQNIQSRLVVLEQDMSTLQRVQEVPWPATMKELDSRVLKLERARSDLDVSSYEEGIKRPESMLERERRERRSLVSKLESKNNSLAQDVAVLQGENEGLRERLNKLTGKIRSVAEGRAYQSREEKEQSY
ncbi:hypothetical protein KCU85_g5910, partial [Aureobasidium melanogenum]